MRLKSAISSVRSMVQSHGPIECFIFFLDGLEMMRIGLLLKVPMSRPEL